MGQFTSGPSLAANAIKAKNNNFIFTFSMHVINTEHENICYFHKAYYENLFNRQLNLIYSRIFPEKEQQPSVENNVVQQGWKRQVLSHKRFPYKI